MAVIQASVPLNYPGDLHVLEPNVVIEVAAGAIVTIGKFGGPPIGRVLSASIKGDTVLIKMDISDRIPAAQAIINDAELQGWGYEVAVRGTGQPRTVELHEVVAAKRRHFGP